MEIRQDRYHVHIDGRPVLHDTMRRDWLCGVCARPLVTRLLIVDELDLNPLQHKTEYDWHTVCAQDPTHSITPWAFMHQAQYERIEHYALLTAPAMREAMAYLPEDVRELILKHQEEATPMPIIGLTDRDSRPPEIGRLRKGGPKPSAKRPGPDLTYFRFTSDYPETLSKWEIAYPGEPRDISVVMYGQRVEDNWSTWREQWVAGGLLHRCDGEYTTELREVDGGFATDPRPCPGGCKPVGRLNVLIPQLGRLAVVTLVTTSLADIMTLTENLKFLFDAGGKDLRGIPMFLRRRERQISTPKIHPKGHPQAGQRTGERVRRKVWLCLLEAAPEYVERKMLASHYAAMEVLELPEPDNGNVTVDSETGEILQTEPGVSWPDGFTSYTDAQADETPPPDEKPRKKPKSGGNGNGKPVILSGAWRAAADALAKRSEAYRTESGKADYDLMLEALGRRKHTEVTDENLLDLISELELDLVEQAQMEGSA